jgi:hypothetical protein
MLQEETFLARYKRLVAEIEILEHIDMTSNASENKSDSKVFQLTSLENQIESGNDQGLTSDNEPEGSVTTRRNTCILFSSPEFCRETSDRSRRWKELR